MRTRALLLCLAATLATTSAACGGASTRKTGKTEAKRPKLPPVKPQALRAFDRGLRELKREGPDANEKAANRFRDATDIDPKLWEAWHNIGVTMLEDGDDQASVQAFDKALSINPDYRDSIAGRAEAHRLGGNHKAAAKDYRKLIELDTTNLDSYARLASLLRVHNQFEDGLDVLREALRTAPPTSSIYVELGLIYLAQGRDELALLVLGKAGELDRNDPAVYNALALVALGDGNDQLAFQYFDKASELDPSYVDTRFNKASVLIDAGDYERAKVELDMVLSAAPDDLEALNALGIAQRGLGKLELARKSWEDVVKRAPRRSMIRGHALFNLAILEADFIMDDAKAIAALDRYLQNSSSKHPRRKEAEELKKELGP